MLHKAYFVCAHVGEETEVELFEELGRNAILKLRKVQLESNFVRLVYSGDCQRNPEGKWTVKITHEWLAHNGDKALTGYLSTHDHSDRIGKLLDLAYPASPEWLTEQALKETEEFHLTHK